MRESGPLNIDGGKVMEMLVKMAEVLVKIAMIVMAPGSVPVPPEARGREPPFFFFFLDLLPRWEKGFPLVRGFHGMGGARAPSRLDLSICFCVPDSALSPFLIFPEIRNSDWAEILTRSLSGY